MKKQQLLLLVFSVIFTNLVTAQITITQADIAPTGSIKYRGTDTSYTNTAIGAGGTGMVWNFSSLTIDKRDTLSFVTASSLPNYSTFPTSNLGLVLSGKGTAYAILNATALKVIGLAGVVQGTPVVAKINPAETIVKFPASYGTTYRDSSITHAGPLSYTAQPTVDSIRFKSTKVKQVSIDAWGSLTVPFGTFSVIRQKEIITQNDIIDVHSIGFPPLIPGIWTNFQNTTKNSTHYSYWANGLGYPVMEVDSLSTGKVNITWLLQTPVGIKEQIESTNAIVYPNPAKNNLFLKLATNEIATIEIADVLGRIVKQAIQQHAIATIYVGDLSKGIYTYRIIYLSGKQESGKFIVENDF